MMNNFDKILAKIREDAEKKIAEIEIDRDNQLAMMQERVDTAVSDIEASAKAQAQKDGEAIFARANAAASMKKREILLRKKADLLDQVYRLAEETLCHLPDDEYISLLAKLTADAVSERLETICTLTTLYGEEESAAEPVSEFQILLSPADHAKHGNQVLEAAQTVLQSRMPLVPKLVLSENTAKITGGVIVRYGDIETCCSIPAMLAGIREKADTKIASLLFD